jgi:hypothetical protein
VRRWKRWYTVLVGRDHRKDRRKSNGCRRRKKSRARWHGGSESSDGGRRQGRDPLCVIGGVVESVEGVAGEKGVSNGRRNFFQITTAMIDPQRNTATRTDKRKTVDVGHERMARSN